MARTSALGAVSPARHAPPRGLSSHPNVVTIYDVGEHAGRVFMVMELMRGGTMGERLKRHEHVPHDTALRWLGEAAAALDTAHAAGVVHRDIKPGNLLLDHHERLAVADFGIARVAWEDQLTVTGQILAPPPTSRPSRRWARPPPPLRTATRSPSSPTSC